MSHVVGVDLSTRAIDLVKLAEDSNRAEWVRCELAGATAWERTLSVRWAMRDSQTYNWTTGGFWDDVYLVAIETPVNDQKRVLSRVQGAVISALPHHLRQPHCCWDVHPSTWKAGLGLKGKPTAEDILAIGGDRIKRCWGLTDYPVAPPEHWQNARDAYCLALYCRDANAKAVEKALGAA